LIILFDFKFTSVCFFFSSRRRHTRSKRDWSSDVCSSNLSFLAQFLHLTLGLVVDVFLRILILYVRGFMSLSFLTLFLYRIHLDRMDELKCSRLHVMILLPF